MHQVSIYIHKHLSQDLSKMQKEQEITSGSNSKTCFCSFYVDLGAKSNSRAPHKLEGVGLGRGGFQGPSQP